MIFHDFPWLFPWFSVVPGWVHGNSLGINVREAVVLFCNPMGDAESGNRWEISQVFVAEMRVVGLDMRVGFIWMLCCAYSQYLSHDWFDLVSKFDPSSVFVGYTGQLAPQGSCSWILQKFDAVCDAMYRQTTDEKRLGLMVEAGPQAYVAASASLLCQTHCMSAYPFGTMKTKQGKS